MPKNPTRKTKIADARASSDRQPDRRFNIVRCFRDARKTRQVIQRDLTLAQAKTKVSQNSLWQDCYEEQRGQ